MSHDDPTLLASALTEEVLRLLRGEESSENWRKVGAAAEDLARLAHARGACRKRQERLDAAAEARRSAPAFVGNAAS